MEYLHRSRWLSFACHILWLRQHLSKSAIVKTGALQHRIRKYKPSGDGPWWLRGSRCRWHLICASHLRDEPGDYSELALLELHKVANKWSIIPNVSLSCNQKSTSDHVAKGLNWYLLTPKTLSLRNFLNAHSYQHVAKMGFEKLTGDACWQYLCLIRCLLPPCPVPSAPRDLCHSRLVFSRRLRKLETSNSMAWLRRVE